MRTRAIQWGRCVFHHGAGVWTKNRREIGFQWLAQSSRLSLERARPPSGSQQAQQQVHQQLITAGTCSIRSCCMCCMCCCCKFQLYEAADGLAAALAPAPSGLLRGCSSKQQQAAAAAHTAQIWPPRWPRPLVGIQLAFFVGVVCSISEIKVPLRSLTKEHVEPRNYSNMQESHSDDLRGYWQLVGSSCGGPKKLPQSILPRSIVY